MANTYVSGQLKDAAIVGKPRDLMDVIFNIAPTDTPFLSMCGKAKCSQTLHEWQTDDLAAPAANARLEGVDTTNFQYTTTEELNNKTQILSKAIQVSGTAQAVKQAGVSKQYAYQMALRSKELKKDLEYALLSNQLSASESGSNPRKMAGLPTWIRTNTSLGANGAVATNSAVAPAGTKRVPTEALLKNVLTSVYNEGGNCDRLMMAPAMRVKFSEILGSGNTKMEMVEKKKATATIDVYVSDFGTIKLIPNRVQAAVPYSADTAYLLDPQYWKVAYLRGFKEEKLALTGDNMKGHILVECTLEARQPKSSGMIADLKTA